ncbi:MAG: zf-HC2 domain-containing protein [Candidatus Omnitrophica bacterium]|nr:zf-HC2 domain-containing protein [Candidatus Omnitrophota bacterium]
MNCNDIENLLFEYVSGRLDEKNRQIVADHLKTCPTCCAELAVIEKFNQLTEPCLSIVVEAPEGYFDTRIFWS